MGKNTMPLLQNLTEDELASIVEIGAMRENTFDKNEVIFHTLDELSNHYWGNAFPQSEWDVYDRQI